ncbi:MAG: hypothetical protein ACRD4S_06585 [Candidatus Acidiferrales bacterium]
MPIDPARTECTLHNDPRLIAAVGAVVSHASQRTGLSDEAQAALSAASEDACRETFSLGPVGNAPSNPDGTDVAIHVIVENFPDRVEVAIENPEATGDAQRVQDRIRGIQERTKVDDVNYETRGGRGRITLVEYLKASAPAG